MTDKRNNTLGEENGREIMREAMRQRPGDPWPRGMGHVILAEPGSRREDKAYHEPGGSFSPAAGSFGISIWVTDRQGKLLATSDDIPLEQMQQRFRWSHGPQTPHLFTETPYYTASWDADRWACRLWIQRQEGMDVCLTVVIRSVGPAGGPIHSLAWEEQRLRINGRWTITCDPHRTTVDLGSESEPDWKTAHPKRTYWDDTTGWGYARFALTGGHGYLVIRNAEPIPVSPLPSTRVRKAIVLDLPDEEFTRCLDSQAAHLLMGLVGRETRPGDPTNYPLNWLRDGAYTLAALARAGHQDLVRELARPFAENDFFGGFGAEADAPGLALWALEEVAARPQEPEFDHWLWPHAARKAGLILKMLAADTPLDYDYTGPIVPQHAGKPELTRVCEPARDGLIIGKMDHHYPVLFVNAVSYAGLRAAASLAARLGHADEAERWQSRAAELQRAWVAAFRPTAAENERTYISGIWPTGITAPCREAFLQGLEARWQQHYDAQGQPRQFPLWTYFNVAEAHQWLLLGQPERAWSILRWFWEHQASPGLYTWWEGNGEENSFHLWERQRGWVNPPHVTPHYWTAAEMLLLQLDMLTTLDETEAEPVLVIGAGIPAAWLDRRMQARGINTRLGRVDWCWDTGEMRVTLFNHRCPVRLGPAFGSDVPLHVDALIPSRP